MTDEIPADIMQAAGEVYDSLSTQCINSSPHDFRAEDISFIARAIWAERQRCVKVAEDISKRGTEFIDTLSGALTANIVSATKKLLAGTAEEIVKHILKGDPQ